MDKKHLLLTYILIACIGLFSLLQMPVIIAGSEDSPNNYSFKEISVKPLKKLHTKKFPISIKTHKFQTCKGEWIKLDVHQKPIYLQQTILEDWKDDSLPSVLTSTLHNKNTVIMGHNGCPGGLCNYAVSDFAHLIYAQVGQQGQMCSNGTLYEGQVLYSAAVPETYTELLGDWLQKDIVTLFTCYGNCKNQNCTSTDQRWAVAFEKYPQ